MTFEAIRVRELSIWAKPDGMQQEDFDSEANHSFTAHYVIRPLVKAASKEKLVSYSMGIGIFAPILAVAESVVRLALAVISSPLLLAGLIPRFRESTWTVYPIMLFAGVELAFRAALEGVSQSFEILKEKKIEMPALKLDDTALVELWQRA
jgi:hypothetical protein